MAAGSSITGPVKVVAMGGPVEIGLNLAVLEYRSGATAIDAGLMFPKRAAPSAGLLSPDLTYLEESRHLLGVIPTHAHEDHTGMEV